MHVCGFPTKMENDVMEVSYGDVSVMWVMVCDVIVKGVQEKLLHMVRLSKLLILRESRAQQTIIGYYGVSPHWVCQEYSTKWQCVF